MCGRPPAKASSWEDDHSPSIANSVPRSSSPPTVTTSVPGAGPSLRTAMSPWTDATVIGARTNVSGPALVYVHVAALDAVDDRGVRDRLLLAAAGEHHLGPAAAGRRARPGPRRRGDTSACSRMPRRPPAERPPRRSRTTASTRAAAAGPPARAPSPAARRAASRGRTAAGSAATWPRTTTSLSTCDMATARSRGRCAWRRPP